MKLTGNDKACCDVYKDLIPLVKDGVACEKSRELVLKHIADCVDCMREYESYFPLQTESEQDMKDGKTMRKAKLAVWLGAIALLLFGIALGVDVSTAMARFLFLIPAVCMAIFAIVRRKDDMARLAWVLGAFVGIGGAYILWSNITLFEYDVGQWAVDSGTFTVGFVCVTSAFFGKRLLAAFTFAGYNLGIIAGGLFGQTSYDPGGGLLHDGWQIWIFVLITSAAMGVAAEMIAAKAAKKGRKNGI